MNTLKCDDCGQFCDGGEGCSIAYIYDMVAMQCDREHLRCKKCTDKYGPVQSNAKPHDGDMRPYQFLVT